MMEQFSRLTAHKLWLNNLNENSFVSSKEDFESSYLLLNEKKISRVNIIANVVSKFKSEDGNYCAITIDDSSAQVRLKTWREDTKILDNIDIGDIVSVIGKVKNYNNEIYILPEIVKKVSPNDELLRKLELIKEYGSPKEDNLKEKEPEINYEEINFASNDLRNKILNLIEKYEEKSGITLEEIKLELHNNLNDINKVLEELLKEGQIYEVKGKYRLLL